MTFNSPKEQEKNAVLFLPDPVHIIKNKKHEQKPDSKMQTYGNVQNKDIGTSVLNYTDDTFGMESSRENSSFAEFQLQAMQIKNCVNTSKVCAKPNVLMIDDSKDKL